MQGIRKYEFDDEDFSSLSFPVHQISNSASITMKFPMLQKFPEFKPIKPLRLTKIFKYIVYMYDYNSPLRTQINDWRHRKINAMWLAGYDINPETNRFDVPVDEVLQNKNDDVEQMIFRYCRITKSQRYSTLVALESGYAAALERLSEGDSKAVQQQQQLQKQIDSVLSELLAEDNQGNIRTNFLDYVDMDSLGIRPEEIAELMKIGEPILVGTNPYTRARRKEPLTQNFDNHIDELNKKYGAAVTTD